MTALAAAIVDEFGLPERPQRGIIAKQKVLEWMKSDDIEALGALYAFLMKPEYATRIQPALTVSDYWRFVASYFERCFTENPNGEWAHTRYSAGWDLASWFGTLWTDANVSLDLKKQIKEWLATQYNRGDADVKRCIVDATLEHLFENREIARFFDDWKNDPELSVAFREAVDWSH